MRQEKCKEGEGRGWFLGLISTQEFTSMWPCRIINSLYMLAIANQLYHIEYRGKGSRIK